MRPGKTEGNLDTPDNLAFGRPPVCILRIAGTYGLSFEDVYPDIHISKTLPNAKIFVRYVFSPMLQFEQFIASHLHVLNV
jgi:hypothetical protein